MYLTYKKLNNRCLKKATLLGFECFYKLTDVILKALLAFTVYISATLPVSQAIFAKDIDYKDLTHTINVESLRSGNHDEDGTNEYEISVALKIYKIPPIKLDRRKRVIKQQITVHDTQEIGTLPEIKIPVLTEWKPSESEKAQFSFKIEGDTLRKSVAEFMNTHSLKEAEIGHEIILTLVEKAWLPYIQKDQKISEARYKILEFFKTASSNEVDLSPDNKSAKLMISVKFSQNTEET